MGSLVCICLWIYFRNKNWQKNAGSFKKKKKKKILNQFFDPNFFLFSKNKKKPKNFMGMSYKAFLLCCSKLARFILQSKYWYLWSVACIIKNITIVNGTPRVVRMTIVSDAPSCGVIYDHHSDDSRGVFYTHRVVNFCILLSIVHTFLHWKWCWNISCALYMEGSWERV